MRPADEANLAAHERERIANEREAALINVRFVTAAHEASTVARIDAAKAVLADAATRDVRADERDAEADVNVPQGSIHSSIQIPISTTRRSRPDVLRLSTVPRRSPTGRRPQTTDRNSPTADVRSVRKNRRSANADPPVELHDDTTLSRAPNSTLYRM